MPPLDEQDVKQHYRGTGTFTSLRKLVQPGQSVEAEATDIAKNFKTAYPIKDKDYNMRVSLSMNGSPLLLDINGSSVIGQFVAALYPKGPTGPLVPCRVRITRLTERRKTQSEVQVERIEGGATIAPTPANVDRG